MELLTAKQAAAFLRISTITLAKWRAQKQGPAWTRTDQTITYDKEALEAFLEKNSIVSAKT